MSNDWTTVERRMTDWGKDFDLIARGEATAMAEHAPPLEFGQYVAWTEHALGGVTESLSPKHMAANDSVTLCAQIIPPRIRRLPVVYKTLKLCGQCAIKYARLRGGIGA